MARLFFPGFPFESLFFKSQDRPRPQPQDRKPLTVPPGRRIAPCFLICPEKTALHAKAKTA